MHEIFEEKSVKTFLTTEVCLLEIHGLQCIIGRFQTQSAIFKFSDVRKSLIAKQKDRLLSFLILNVKEAKIFDHVFLEGHNV